MEDPKLNINDVANAVEIIKVAQSRGAFKAEEMSQVGITFDALSRFVEHFKAQNAEADPAAAETESAQVEQAHE